MKTEWDCLEKFGERRTGSVRLRRPGLAGSFPAPVRGGRKASRDRRRSGLDPEPPSGSRRRKDRGNPVALRIYAPRCEEARQCIGYPERNRHRMRYPEFRTQELCVSSGVVEAGCKTTIGARLKQSGMFWTLKGSNAIIALRCAKLSGRFEGFFDRRAARRCA